MYAEALKQAARAYFGTRVPEEWEFVRWAQRHTGLTAPPTPWPPPDDDDDEAHARRRARNKRKAAKRQARLGGSRV